jgi:transcriptional regulator GlxA family with amidase domain
LGTTELAHRYPGIRVDPDVLYVDNGQILSSAGAAAGFDLCLQTERRDGGSAVAADAAACSSSASSSTDTDLWDDKARTPSGGCSQKRAIESTFEPTPFR